MKQNVQFFQNFSWINISAPEKGDLPEIAKEYKLDYYQIQDSLETGHLPKIEQYPDYTFIILRAYTAQNNSRITNVREASNKIAFFISEKRIITIHRAEFNFLHKIEKSFESTREFFLYILHKMINTYERPSIETSEKIDEIEHIIFLKKSAKISIKDLYYLKTETRISKKILIFTQNVINELKVSEALNPSLEDVKDSLKNFILILDESTDEINTLLTTYHSVNAQSTNDVMKLLTVFSAFFLPLTFIVGVYGMNFKYMPELNWKYGYLMSIIIMLIVSLLIYIWFRRKKIF